MKRSSPARSQPELAIGATPARASGAPWILGAALLLLLLVRLLAELSPNAVAWGLDYARFLAPGVRFGPWLVALALALLATRSQMRDAGAGLGRIGSGRFEGHVIAALICGALCIAFPDLILFTGDFALRRSAIAGITDFDRLFPQATPLDRFVHLVVPRTLRGGTGLSVETVASGTGVVEAMIFGALSVEFASRSGARGLAALVAVAVIAGSGAIGLFTGYDKALAEVSIVTLAFGVAGLGELTRGRAGWASGLLVVLAVAFHRSGLALLPAWIALWWMTARAAPAASPATKSAPAPKHRATVTPQHGVARWPWARLVPALLLLALIPFALRTSGAVDARHLAPNGAASMLSEAFAAPRLRALANLAVFLVPLLPLLPVAWALARPGREPVVRWLALLALCWLLPCFLIHPVQGEFRDWDDFTAASVAVSLPLAWLLSRTPARAAPLAIALAAAAVVPRIQWLALESSTERALARIEAWAAAPHPPRSTAVAFALEHAAIVHYREGRMEAARRTMTAAVAEAPWTRVYLEWANAETNQGDWELAKSLYLKAARQDPSNTLPWFFMADASLRKRDRETALRAAAGLRRLTPQDPRIGQIEAAARQIPASPLEVAPDSS